MSAKPKLLVNWATHAATKHACKTWHYSKTVPAGKLVKIGIWEDDVFKGVVIYSRGATPHIGSPYGLTQYEVCELTRVALDAHQTPVSRILAITFKFMRQFCPGIQLIVSYADADQNHHGGIYQATNWIYEGLLNAGTRGAFIVNGKKTHPRTIGAQGGVQSLKWIKANIDADATEFVTKGKHKYLMPLTVQLRSKLVTLHKPYPKRAPEAEASMHPDSIGGTGGSSPTSALQLKGDESGEE